ncbi:MAG TPA: hypothetical protein K8V05_10410 [Butyricimonas virosa]|uniref:Uncharacterized protein n=1 Tax=Butyricimonas virosa TaxID=544645 RepID=A0A921H7I1_9BACT|nr:hypothetical protein [Butyricimonas virosa]
MVFLDSGCHWNIDRASNAPRSKELLESVENRLSKEGNEPVTICNRLKLLAEDGKIRLTYVARRGGDVAREARLKLEEETGRKVVTPLNAKDMFGKNQLCIQKFYVVW